MLLSSVQPVYVMQARSAFADGGGIGRTGDFPCSCCQSRSLLHWPQLNGHSRDDSAAIATPQPSDTPVQLDKKTSQTAVQLQYSIRTAEFSTHLGMLSGITMSEHCEAKISSSLVVFSTSIVGIGERNVA